MRSIEPGISRFSGAQVRTIVRALRAPERRCWPSTNPHRRLTSFAVSLLDLIDSAPHEAALLPDRFQKWFAARGWSPREHQLALLQKAREDSSALLIAPTGAGKTLAGFLPTLVELSTPA